MSEIRQHRFKNAASRGGVVDDENVENSLPDL